MRDWRQSRAVVYVGVVLVGCLVGMGLPAQGGSGGRGAVGVAVSATYKGLTTTRGYVAVATRVAGTGTATGTRGESDPPEGGTPNEVRVEAIGVELRRSYRIDAFYTKELTIGGIVVMGSERVSDWAFLEAAYTYDHMLQDSPQWVRDALARNRVRISIMAVVEYTMDLPENQIPDYLRDPAYHDKRGRGLGNVSWCSCGEENLLNLRGDPYGGNGRQGSGENITIHEFSHVVAFSIQRAQGRNGSFWARLQKAMSDSLLPGGRLETYNRVNRTKVYASESVQEFWAEGAQAWFDNAEPRNAGGLAVRADVKTKEPALAALLTEVYGDGAWRYIKTTAKKRDGTYLRPAEEMEHLKGLELVRGEFPVFSYENSPRIIAAAATQAGTATAPR